LPRQREPVDIVPSFLPPAAGTGRPRHVSTPPPIGCTPELLPKIRRKRRVACFADLAWTAIRIAIFASRATWMSRANLALRCKIHADQPSSSAAIAMALRTAW
jgi:hypothetical protein